MSDRSSETDAFSAALPESFLIPLYGGDTDRLERETARYVEEVRRFTSLFEDRPAAWFSAPGRTEISGNHTDHNHGRVLAASINLDSIAAVSLNTSNQIIVHSEGFEDPFIVQINDLEKKKDDIENSSALIRGTLHQFKKMGYSLSGLNINITSDVSAGSGLSSSASFEILIGTIFNTYFANDELPPETLAHIGKFAENEAKSARNDIENLGGL